MDHEPHATDRSSVPLALDTLDHDVGFALDPSPVRLAELWGALVAGHVRLVDCRREGPIGEHRYRIVTNTLEERQTRALSPGEILVLDNAANGLSMKAIAYTLGIASPTVSARLARAAAKVGANGRLDVVRLARTLGDRRRPSSPAQLASLTAAERDVLALVQRGLTNERIAAARGRSARTIANQISSILRKTGGGSRRELALLPLLALGSRKDAGAAPPPPGSPVSRS
jgi:DNA-binding NarL/FixJ family response regulator